jgi:hypothetical protein
MDVTAEAESLQVVQKLPAQDPLRGQVLQVLVGEAELPDHLQQGLQAGEHGEAASEGRPAEEHLEHSLRVVLLE